MQQDRGGFAGETVRAIQESLTRVVPAVLLIGSLIAIWWIVVARSDSAIARASRPSGARAPVATMASRVFTR